MSYVPPHRRRAGALPIDGLRLSCHLANCAERQRVRIQVATQGTQQMMQKLSAGMPWKAGTAIFRHRGKARSCLAALNPSDANYVYVTCPDARSSYTKKLYGDIVILPVDCVTFETPLVSQRTVAKAPD